MMNDEKDFFLQFAYRFDYDDGEYLKTNGYSQAEIDIKLRILKVRNLEFPFQLNPYLNSTGQRMFYTFISRKY